jgi:hypothetical protein
LRDGVRAHDGGSLRQAVGTPDAAPSVRDKDVRRETLEEYIMNTETMERTHYELRFQSLFDAGRAYVFPCDASGRVDMDTLGDRALNNYLYARAVVGREFLMPSIQMEAAR